MSRTQPSRVRVFAPALIATFTAAAFIPVTAHAQFGGLMKRAAAKVAGDKASEKVNQATLPSAKGEALTDATFANVLKGAQAAAKTLEQRDQLRAKQEADQKALTDLESQNEGTRSAYNKANETILECRDASFNALGEKRDAELQEKYKNDPQTIAKLQMISMKYAKAIADAQQKGDTAGMMKAQLDMQKEILGNDIYALMKADTAATDKKCGTLPAKPASLDREEKLRAAIDQESDSIRTLEATAVNVGAQASGMDKVRYLELKERVFTIYGTLNGRRAPVAYGKEEVELVKGHMSDIEPVKRAL
jgi:hypothetical protein